jgi:ribokinase
MTAIVVVSGYATMDYVLEAAAEPRGFGTVMARIARAGWPRAGGAPLYLGARLAVNGLSATPLVTVGDDANGRLYREAVAAMGLDDAAIARTDGTTAACILAHHISGRYACFLDPGSALDVPLSATQAAAADGAGLVCIAAASAAQTRALLDRLRPDQRLAWIVKADPACFPEDLRAILAARADIVFRNVHERAFAGATTGLLVETDGGAAVTVTGSGGTIRVEVAPVVCSDPTGAGDTFAGEFLAHWVADPLAVHAAAAMAVIATRTFLTARSFVVPAEAGTAQG